MSYFILSCTKRIILAAFTNALFLHFVKTVNENIVKVPFQMLYQVNKEMFKSRFYVKLQKKLICKEIEHTDIH